MVILAKNHEGPVRVTRIFRLNEDQRYRAIMQRKSVRSVVFVGILRPNLKGIEVEKTQNGPPEPTLPADHTI